MNLKSILIFIALTFFCTATFASPSIEDFLAEPIMRHASVSPNGQYIASVWNKKDSRMVVVYDIVNEKVVSSFGDNIIRPYSVNWANDKRLLVKFLVPWKADKVRKDAQTKENFDINNYYMFARLVSINMDGTGAVGLFNDQRRVLRSRNLVSITDYLVDDKDHILMSAFHGERLALFKLNIEKGSSQRVVKGGKFTIAFVNDPDSNEIYRYDYRRIAKTIEIKRYLTDDDEWENIDTIYFDEDDQNKNRINFKDLVGVRESKLVYRKLNKETGFHELVTIQDNKPEVLVSIENTDIVGVLTEGFNQRVIGYKTLKDVYRSHYFSPKIQETYDAIASNFTDENFIFSSISKQKDRAIVKSWGASNPLSYWIVDFDTVDIKQFVYPYKTLPYEKLAVGKALDFATRDNQKIRTYIYIRPDYDPSKPFPAVILPHGGPQARDTLNYSDFV